MPKFTTEQLFDIIKAMLDEKIKKQIRKIIGQHLPADNYKIFIFGSRTTEEHRRFSDIDVGILGQERIPGHIIVKIKEELENSRVPYKIDVVDFQTVSDEFRRIALKKVLYL